MSFVASHLREPGQAILAAGAALTIFLAAGVAFGLNGGGALVVIVGTIGGLAVVAAFVSVPHIAMAATIPLFALIPTLKWFVWPWSGGAKDAVVICAAIAAAVVAWRRFHAGQPARVDPVILSAVLVLGVLYVVDAGGDRSAAWLDGVRIALGPPLLLLAGLTLENPRRNLNWTVGSLALTATPIAVYGLGQQFIGPDRLADLGYSFAQQIRTVDGQLRSFGTFDDAFGYTSFLLIAGAAALAWYRPRGVVFAWAALILAGVAAGLVRTAALVAAVVAIGLLLKSGRQALALGVVVACFAALIGFLAIDRPQAASSSSSTEQSRTEIWEEAIGPPGDWLAGRGVGELGTAAERQEIGAVRSESDPNAGQSNAGAIDSGYVATVTDVGLLGFLVLVVLLSRLGFLSYLGIRGQDRAGWVAMLTLLALCIDALTRASFTAFPTAYVAFLVVGVALAAVREGYAPVRDRTAATTGFAEPSRR